jgi:hypothetical protein
MGGCWTFASMLGPDFFREAPKYSFQPWFRGMLLEFLLDGISHLHLFIRIVLRCCCRYHSRERLALIKIKKTKIILLQIYERFSFLKGNRSGFLIMRYRTEFATPALRALQESRKKILA